MTRYLQLHLEDVSDMETAVGFLTDALKASGFAILGVMDATGIVRAGRDGCARTSIVAALQTELSSGAGRADDAEPGAMPCDFVLCEGTRGVAVTVADPAPDSPSADRVPSPDEALSARIRIALAAVAGRAGAGAPRSGRQGAETPAAPDRWQDFSERLATKLRQFRETGSLAPSGGEPDRRSPASAASEIDRDMAALSGNLMHVIEVLDTAEHGRYAETHFRAAGSGRD